MQEEFDNLVSRLRFRHLRLLVELHRFGTLGKAAATLHLSQPALSKTLKEIEDAFGFPLFQRSARGLAATSRGEVIVQGAQTLLSALGHLSEAAQASEEKPVAVLHLGAPPAVAAGDSLPAVLARLQARSERVVVRLREQAVPQLFEALLQGELDALLTSFNQTAFAAKRATRLVYKRCSEHEYVVIASPAHPLARRRSVGWDALVHDRWIMAEPELLSRQALEGQFLRAGVAVPAPSIISNNPATNVQLVAAGAGLAAVPRAMATAEQRLGRIAVLRVEMTPSRVPVALVYRAASSGDPAIRLLHAVVQELTP
ncbi:DNA-binding transcriptional LysR family regulator [Variovorax sp. SG517]|uniref:LysR family transcriptional regulator n=1 Tax=Variovorax sp. SG517 TaxID=2587117 RepID=UPI00159E606E|nr:LysR family transcriptional regulator [Variovorax sp. SG517]NVM92972.1 DNA-binding transcriptional LysR family regulator [Variovorax sp. SG517]